MFVFKRVFVYFLFVIILYNPKIADSSELELDTTVIDDFIKEGQNWGAKFNLGFGMARGNTDYLTVQGDMFSFKKFGRITPYLIAEIDYRESSGKKDTNSAYVTVRADYRIKNRWNWTFLDTVGHNEFTKIRLQNTIGAGPLYKIEYKKIKNGTSLIIAYEYEKYQDYTVRRNPIMTLRNEFELSLNEYTSLFIDFYYSPFLDEFSDYRIKLKPKIETKIYSDWLAFFVASKIEHDSKPVLGVKRNDFQITTGLSFKAN